MTKTLWQRVIEKWFTEHPASVSETYAEHFSKAMHFAMKLFYAGFACAIHAIVPGCCVTTGSKAIRDLHDEMVTFRVKKPAADSADGTSIEYMI